MSILIKGMKMPNNCATCVFGITGVSRCLINLSKLGRENNFFRPNKCPLVEIEEEQAADPREKGTWGRKMTMYERIKAMSEEEMARSIIKAFWVGSRLHPPGRLPSEDSALAFLRSEYKGGEEKE